jgi:hypothetical protein
MAAQLAYDRLSPDWEQAQSAGTVPDQVALGSGQPRHVLGEGMKARTSVHSESGLVGGTGGTLWRMRTKARDRR